MHGMILECCIMLCYIWSADITSHNTASLYHFAVLHIIWLFQHINTEVSDM